MYTKVNGKVLFLKCVNKNNMAYNNFLWPEKGIVKPNTWDSDPSCGNGLHGWYYGIGIGDGKDADIINDKWIVFEAKEKDIVKITDSLKFKVKQANVIYNGNFEKAFSLVKDYIGDSKSIIFKSSKQIVSDDDYAEILERSKSILSTGYSSKIHSILGGYIVSTGNNSNIHSDCCGAVIISTGILSSINSTGDCRILSTGENTVVHTGINSKVRVGENSSFTIKYTDRKGFLKTKMGITGRNGIKANTWYKVVNSKIVEV